MIAEIHLEYSKKYRTRGESQPLKNLSYTVTETSEREQIVKNIQDIFRIFSTLFIYGRLLDHMVMIVRWPIAANRRAHSIKFELAQRGSTLLRIALV